MMSYARFHIMTVILLMLFYPKLLLGSEAAGLNEIEALRKLGHQYVNEERYEKAVEVLSRIAGQRPFDAQVMSDMAGSLNRLKRYPEALPYAQKEVALDPQNGDAWRRLGDAYRHDKTKERAAIEAYEKAIQLQGPNPVNQFDMGVTYECFGKCDQGLPYLERALAMEPDSKEIKWYFYSHLGRCYMALGKNQEAVAAFQKILEKFPVVEQGKAYYWLSVVYKKLGQEQQAQACERRAKEIWDMQENKNQ